MGFNLLNPNVEIAASHKKYGSENVNILTYCYLSGIRRALCD